MYFQLSLFFNTTLLLYRVCFFIYRIFHKAILCWGYENKSGIESVNDTLRIHSIHLKINNQKRYQGFNVQTREKIFTRYFIFIFFLDILHVWGTKTHSERISANWINISIAIKYLCVFWRYNFYDRRQWRWNFIFFCFLSCIHRYDSFNCGYTNKTIIMKLKGFFVLLSFGLSRTVVDLWKAYFLFQINVLFLSR